MKEREIWKVKSLSGNYRTFVDGSAQVKVA
jgi:hypothetical protein